MQNQSQKSEITQNLVEVNVADLPIEKTLEYLLFDSVDFNDISKLGKLHTINNKQHKHLLKTLEECIKKLKKL
jgi:hypothetical protein